MEFEPFHATKYFKQSNSFWVFISLSCVPKTNYKFKFSDVSASESWRLMKLIGVIFTTVCCSKSSYLCDKRLTRFPSASGLVSERNPFNESSEFCSLLRPNCKAALGLEVMQYNLVNLSLKFSQLASKVA